MIKTALRLIGFIIPLTVLLGTNNETFVLTDVMNPQKLCVSGENMIVVDGFEFYLLEYTKCGQSAKII